MIAQEIGGASLYASVGTISGAGLGPGVPTGSVTDPSGDAGIPQLGAVTPVPAIQDLLGSSVTQPDKKHLRVTMQVAGDMAHSQAVGSPGGCGSPAGRCSSRTRR